MISVDDSWRILLTFEDYQSLFSIDVTTTLSMVRVLNFPESIYGAVM